MKQLSKRPPSIYKVKYLGLAHCRPLLIPLILLSIVIALSHQWIFPWVSPWISLGNRAAAAAAISVPSWQLLSTVTDALPLPSASEQQTAALLLDIDNDGLLDFVIAARRAPGPSLVWYQRQSTGWARYIIDPEPLAIEAGGAYFDIDNDGDQDIVMGGDNRENQLWWWENPAPDFDPDRGWQRRLIKDSGLPKHHDQLFGDFDGDGRTELVFWNQYAGKLLLATIPTDPRQTTPWPLKTIYSYEGVEHEGLAKADIDGDGIMDIIGGGRWFRYHNGQFEAQIIDDDQRFARVAAGQLKSGDRPEVVFVCGDCVGPLRWYEWNGANWVSHDLLDVPVDHGHSLAIADLNSDGALDIFVAEMRLGGANTEAATRLFLGDDTGNFLETRVATGYGYHESKIGDLDGDGDLDILGKPYNWETPRLDIWLNQQACTPLGTETVAQWQRHVIDAQRPWRAIFIDSADLDGDGDADIVAGGWWYENPGMVAAPWPRHAFGSQLANMALIYDFDGDGSSDLLGTAGRGSQANAIFAWAQNDGQGHFTIHENIATGDGDFLQGVAPLSIASTQRTQIALSWHDASKPLQLLTLEADSLGAPTGEKWSIRQLSLTTQGEALTAVDIDRDGDQDLMLGTQWLRNEGDDSRWTPFTVAQESMPDRHRLADLNGDGRLDVIVGFEGVGVAAKLAWYAQPADPTMPWAEKIIDYPIGPMSLDLHDMDGDGDMDLIVGEHAPNDPANAGLFVYENRDGFGESWRQQLVYRGDEHHDGAQTVDIDGDGDQDIISTGWKQAMVLLYENLANNCDPAPSPSATATVVPIPSKTATPSIRLTATPTLTPTPATGEADPSTATPTVLPSSTYPTATPKAETTLFYYTYLPHITQATQ